MFETPVWETAPVDGACRVLWIARHQVSEEERAELENLLGPCLIHRYTGYVGHPEQLYSILAWYQPDRVVSVLPITLQVELVGIAFIRQMPPVIRPIWHHRKADDLSQLTPLRFVGFDEILDLQYSRRRMGVDANGDTQEATSEEEHPE